MSSAPRPESAEQLAAASAARQVRDKRLRAEFKGKLDTSCSLLVDHFFGLIKAAKVDSRPSVQSDAAAQAGSQGVLVGEVGLAFSEQERLRRGDFQLAVHAESLAAAGKRATIETMIQTGRESC